MFQKGFSLVELSIVLVILGLLTGGILGGQNLMRASELRSVTQEINSWQMAVSTFQDKYFAIPGDMTNAVQFWGRADDGTFAGDCAAPDTDQGTGTQTCNGDGDGGVGNAAHERFRFWQHLANAGLIEGLYTGVGDPGVGDAVIGQNIPRSKIGGGYYSAWLGELSGNATYFDGSYGNIIHLGMDSAAAWPSAGIVAPEEAWNIDTKMDDGLPGQGVMQSWKNTSPAPWDSSCSTTDDPATAEYALSVSQSCSFMFLMPY